MKSLAFPARSSRLIPILVAAFFVASAASAEAAMRFGITGFTGYQGYAMDDINDDIIAISDALSQPGDLVQLDELNGDVSFGLGVKADVSPAWRIYGEYEHLSDNTGGGNQIGSFKLDVSAETFLVGATYFFPSTSKARLGLGAGIGYYDFGGELEANGTIGTDEYSGSASAGGSTIGFDGRGTLDVAMSEKFHFDLALGYRSASGDLEVDGTGTDTDLDWSGVMSRVGVTYFLK